MAKYTQIEQHESAGFLGNTERPAAPSATRTALVAVLASAVALAVGLVVGWTAAASPHRLDRVCAAHTSHASPVVDQVSLAYAPVRFNGSFMHESVYRRPGAPDVDRAWEALGVDYRAGVISAADGPAAGLTPAHVQRADKYGGGFFVNVEGMHHLHCLNLLRKSLYYNYPYYKKMGMHAFSNPDDILQLHVSHCVDTLRQVLMCNVDTGVLGQVWYATEPKDGSDRPGVRAFPDFKTTHTCKDYDAVRRWAEKLQAPPAGELPADYLARPAAGHVLGSIP